jgi:hypothetical protein
VSSGTKQPKRIFEVWFTTKHNASTPEARAALTAALELHLGGFGNRLKRRWHGRTTYGKKRRTTRGHYSEFCVRFSRLDLNLESEATQAALTAIRTVFVDASVQARVTTEEFMARYGMPRDEAAFMALIANGDSDGDCIVIDPATGEVIREHVIEFEA